MVAKQQIKYHYQRQQIHTLQGPETATYRVGYQGRTLKYGLGVIQGN